MGTAAQTTQALSWPSARNGAGPYTYDVQVALAPTAGTAPADGDWQTVLSGLSTLAGSVTGRAAATRYAYRIVTHGAAGQVVTSAPVYGSTASTSIEYVWVVTPVDRQSATVRSAFPVFSSDNEAIVRVTTTGRIHTPAGGPAGTTTVRARYRNRKTGELYEQTIVVTVQ